MSKSFLLFCAFFCFSVQAQVDQFFPHNESFAEVNFRDAGGMKNWLKRHANKLKPEELDWIYFTARSQQKCLQMKFQELYLAAIFIAGPTGMITLASGALALAEHNEFIYPAASFSAMIIAAACVLFHIRTRTIRRQIRSLEKIQEVIDDFRASKKETVD